jgi:putative MATE family efflux protein
MTKFDEEIVSGGTFRSIWKVAWPVIVTQLIANVHGVIDHVMVGHKAGFEGQAAIGASWMLFLVVVVFLSSLFQGMNILVAQYVGRKDSTAVNHIAYHTFLACAYLLFFVVAPAGYLLAPYMLDLMDVLPEIREHALPYLRVLFVVNAPLFFMFLLGGVLQSSGNMKFPMALGIATAATHIGVSYVLINGVGPFPELGTVGAAVGTVLGPLPSVLIGLWLILSGRTIVGRPDKFTLVPDLTILRRSAAIGIPTGIQAVLLNIGGAVLIYFINQLHDGGAALAAYSVCYIQIFAIVTYVGFGVRAACATVIGQNIGAGKLARGERAVYIGAIIGFVWAAIFGVVFWTLPGPLLSVFALDVNSPVGEVARTLLHFLTFSGVFVVVMLAFTGGLQGAGDTRTPMYVAFVTQIVILLGFCLAFHLANRLSSEVIWTAILISHAIRFILTYVIFSRGRWRKIKVTLDAPAAAQKTGAVESADAINEA